MCGQMTQQKRKRKKKIKINRKIDIRWSYELLVDLIVPVAITNHKETLHNLKTVNGGVVK